MLDLRTAQTQLEVAIKDAVLHALGRRLPAVASVAALRAVPTAGATTTNKHDDVLVPIVVAGQVTAHYRWASSSTASDNGASVVKPTDVVAAAPGRWIRWTSRLRLAPVVGGDSFQLHQLATGVVARVIVLDKNMTEEEVSSLILGATPAVVIEATDDDPEPLDLDLGYRYKTTYSFTLTVIAQNLQDRREAAQADAVGANAIDGLLMALLGGAALTFGTGLEAGDVLAAMPGRGHNWESQMGQRRVARSRAWTAIATAVYPGGANDSGPCDEIDAQPQLTDLHGALAVDPLNCLATPFFDLLGAAGQGSDYPAGLTQTIYGGTATIAGEDVIVADSSKTFTARRDTYRDLNLDGTWTFTETRNGGEPPDVPTDALRVGVTSTDASGVVSDRLLAVTRWNYGNPWVIRTP